MAGGFEGGVCGGNWWINPSQNLFTSSPCLFPINDMLTVMKTTATRSINHSSGSASDETSVLLQDTSGNMGSVHSTPKMIDTNLFSPANTDHEWSQDLLFGCGKSDQNYSHHLLQESSAALDSSMDYRHQTRGSDPLRINDTNFYCKDSSSINSSSFSVSQSYNSVSQHLFDLDSQPPQQSLEGCSLPISDMINSNEFLLSYYLPNASYSTPMIKPMTLEKQQSHLHLTHNTPLWNATEIIDNVRASPLVHQSSNNNAKSSNFAVKHHNVEAPEMAEKGNDEPPFKRPRIETPSPLPTFKVRKEKLGDRVTALQQLVSPFGKTDTASVLYEAIEYIKFLHDQVNALSTPYLKSRQSQQDTEKNRHQEEINKDLKSRGLCLVPVSSTFPVASETTADFWTPTFGGSYR